ESDAERLHDPPRRRAAIRAEVVPTARAWRSAALRRAKEREMSFEIDLAGRRALVTGAGQHVGRAIAQALARSGAEVVVNDLRPERCEHVVKEIVEAGGRGRPAVFDV